LTDEAMRDLTRTAVMTVADEAPGADLLGSLRTAAVPVRVLGRCITGLSEAIMLRLAEHDNLDHVRTTAAQLAQTLSALGQLIADPRSASDAGAGAAGPGCHAAQRVPNGAPGRTCSATLRALSSAVAIAITFSPERLSLTRSG
jgi:hypothetical protein